MLTDEELIRRIRAGDEEAAEVLVKRYYSDILRYCKRHTADNNLAEDATQETFYKVFKSLMRYQDKERFKAWIYMIAKNICIDMGKKQRSMVSIEDEEIGEESKELKHIEDDDEIQQMLLSLTEEQREAILLYFEEELTYKEIGKILGIPARTVQSRIRNALKNLKNRGK